MQTGTLRGGRVSKKIGRQIGHDAPLQGKGAVLESTVGNTRAAKPLADALVCFEDLAMKRINVCMTCIRVMQRSSTSFLFPFQ